MSAFVQQYYPSSGDLPFGTHFDGVPATPSPGYLIMPGSSRMCTVSPMPRGSLNFQSPSGLSPDSSFFDEAMDSSPVSMEATIAYSEEQAPQNIFASPHLAPPNAFGNHEPQQPVLPTVETNRQKLPRRPRNRKQSTASSTQSENSISDPVIEPPKPRKRGRKPRKQVKDLKATERREEPDEDGLPKDPRRRRILERNRIAATKCRLRKRDEASALATKEQAMEDQNRYLSSCFDSLTTEIYHLKTQLLRHTDCNCLLIQKYIANEAKKSVEGLMGCSSAFNACEGGSISPEHSGSGNLSSAESMNLQTPDTEHMTPFWSNPFQHPPGPSEAKGDMYDMGMDSYRKASMVSIASDAMGHPQLSNMHSVPEYHSDMYVNMGHPQHVVEDVGWNSHWGFR